MAGQRSLSALHAMLTVSLPEAHALTFSAHRSRFLFAPFHYNSDGVWGETPCSPGPLPFRTRTPAEGNTRMMEQHNLSAPHAMLTISLPESACSLLRRAHPNERNVEPVSFARDAGSHFAKKHMLSPAEGAPDWRIAKPVSPAHDVDIQPVREQMLSHHVPTARAFFPHYPIVIVRGYGA